jgi:hypothetical protein
MLDGNPLVRGVDATITNKTRIETVFKYPDGSSIDVFVDAPHELFAKPRLTDFGQTMSWLLDLPIRPWQSKKRQEFVKDVLRLYSVTQEGGALVKGIENEAELSSDIVALGQACMRTADLIFTRRSALASTFVEDVEEVIADLELGYVSNPEVPGKHGVVRLDFLVQGDTKLSGILTLSAKQPTAARVNATEVFKKWYDLDGVKFGEQRVTIFDDEQDVFREEDLERIRTFSDVIGFSQRENLRTVLAA